MWGQRSVVVNVVTKYQHWTVEWSAVVVVKVWGHMQGRVCSESQFYEMSRYSWRKKNKNKKKEKKRKNGKKKEEGKEKLWEQASSSLGLHKGLCAWKLFWRCLAVNLMILQNDRTWKLLQGLFHPHNHPPPKKEYFHAVLSGDSNSELGPRLGT